MTEPEVAGPRGRIRGRILFATLALVATATTLCWVGEPLWHLMRWTATGSIRQEAMLYDSLGQLGAAVPGWLAERVRVRESRPLVFDPKTCNSHIEADRSLKAAILRLPAPDIAAICRELFEHGDGAAKAYAIRLLQTDSRLFKAHRAHIRGLAVPHGRDPTRDETELVSPTGQTSTCRVPLLFHVYSALADPEALALALSWLGSESRAEREAGAAFFAAIDQRNRQDDLRRWLKGLVSGATREDWLVRPAVVVRAMRRLASARWRKSRRPGALAGTLVSELQVAVRELLPGAEGETRALLESALTPLPDAEVTLARPANEGPG